MMHFCCLIGRYFINLLRRYNFWKGCLASNEIWEGEKRPKFGAVFDNFRPWSQNTSGTQRRIQNLKSNWSTTFHSLLGEKNLWTLVHQQKSYRQSRCHPSGLFFGRLHFGLYGMLPLKFLHALQSPKLYFQSDYGRRAASSWALRHIASFIYFAIVSPSGVGRSPWNFSTWSTWSISGCTL